MGFQISTIGNNMKPWQFFSATCMLFISSLSFAGEVYVCEKNGRKEFSQLPCGENAVVLQAKGEPSSVKLSIPFKPKEIGILCHLVIKAKDRAVQQNKTTRQTYSQNYRYQQQYRNQRYRGYEEDDYEGGDYNPSRKEVDPQQYFLSKIENLETIAKNSPQAYQILKGLVHSVYYQGYEESPLYEAERAAALTNCENNLTNQMSYMQRNSYYDY